MKLKDKQFDWLSMLYECMELRMIQLDINEHRILDKVLNHKEYSIWFDRNILNNLRDRYPFSMLKEFLNGHEKQVWTNFHQASNNVYRSAFKGSWIAVQKNRYGTAFGKPIITSTGGGIDHINSFNDMWLKHDSSIDTKNVRPNNDKL